MAIFSASFFERNRLTKGWLSIESIGKIDQMPFRLNTFAKPCSEIKIKS